jgi:plastocyanin
MPPTKALLLAIFQAYVAVVQAKSWPVSVGAGGELTFTPNTLNAAVDDTIEFQFLSHNHTVTQGQFNTGCAPSSTDAAQCYDSGYVYITDRNSTVFYTPQDTSDIRVMTVPIKNTNTMYFYCAQADHCQSSMVFVVNPQVRSTRETKNADERRARITWPTTRPSAARPKPTCPGQPYAPA